MLFAGVCPTLAAIMSGVADLQSLRRIIIQTIARIGQGSEFIPFPQAEATGFNLCDHLQRTALKHDAAEAGRSVVLYFFTHHSICFLSSHSDMCVDNSCFLKI